MGSQRVGHSWSFVPPDPHTAIPRAVGGAALGRRQVMRRGPQEWGSCPYGGDRPQPLSSVWDTRRSLPPKESPHPARLVPQPRLSASRATRHKFLLFTGWAAVCGSLWRQPRGAMAISAGMHGTTWDLESKKVPIAPQKLKPWSIKLTKHIYARVQKTVKLR